MLVVVGPGTETVMVVAGSKTVEAEAEPEAVVAAWTEESSL